LLICMTALSLVHLPYTPFFLLLLLRRRRSTLFPYTTLFRSLQTSADAIYCARHVGLKAGLPIEVPAVTVNRLCGSGTSIGRPALDRKSTRLNSSHLVISYAVFCLKKKKKMNIHVTGSDRQTC